MLGSQAGPRRCTRGSGFLKLWAQQGPWEGREESPGSPLPLQDPLPQAAEWEEQSLEVILCYSDYNLLLSLIIIKLFIKKRMDYSFQRVPEVILI